MESWDYVGQGWLLSVLDSYNFQNFGNEIIISIGFFLFVNIWSLFQQNNWL